MTPPSTPSSAFRDDIAVPPTSAFRDDIAALRGLAILLVVLFHVAPVLLPGGFIGVDVFFVISGYLITNLLRRDIVRERFSMGHFLLHRARRLLPALGLMLLATAIAGWLVLSPAEYAALGGQIGSSALYASNIWFWRHAGYFSPNATEIPLLHSWSLGVEEQFYLLWPLGLALLMRWRRDRRALVAAALLIAIASLALAQWQIWRPSSTAFFLLPGRAWELLAGAVIALAQDRAAPDGEAPARWRHWLPPLGVAIMIGAAFVIDKDASFPGLGALAPVLGAAIAIAGGDTRRGATLLAPMRWLGQISYSLYLWHWPILVLVPFWLGHGVGLGGRALLLLIAILIAALSERWIERPWRRRESPRRVLAMTAVVTLGGAAIGGAIWASHGVPARWPVNVSRLEQNVDYGGRVVLEQCAALPQGQRGKCDILPAGPVKGTILLWGDSHAGHIALPFTEATRARGMRLAVRRAVECPPTVGDADTERHAALPACQAHNRAVTAEALRGIASGDIRLVVLAMRWNSFFPEVLHLSPEQRLAYIARGFRQPDEPLARQLDRLVARLRAAGAQVLIVDQVPQFELAPRLCALHAAMFTRDPASCRAVEALLPGQRATTHAILAGIAARHGALLWDPSREMCDDRGRCRPVTDDGTVLYSDGNHLSTAGAESLRGAVDHEVAIALAAHD